MNRIFAALVAVLVALPGLASGSPGEGDRYRLVSTLRVSTLEKELNQGAAAGYRVAGLWYSGQLFAVLEKAPGSHDVYECQFIVNLLRNAFDREFADALAAGYVPVSVSHRNGGRRRLRRDFRAAAPSEVDERG
jgi:hypothetical protein